MPLLKNPVHAKTPAKRARFTQSKRPNYSGRSAEILMMFLNATAIPRNMAVSRIQGEVPSQRSNNHPTKAPPAGPAINSVNTRLPCRIPLAVPCAASPERIFSACLTFFSCMSNESSRGSDEPLPSCAGSSEAMSTVPFIKGNRHKTRQPRQGMRVLGGSPAQVNRALCSAG